VNNEQMLFPPDFFMRLRKTGIRHMGMITGRVGPEVDSALERMEAYCGRTLVGCGHSRRYMPQT